MIEQINPWFNTPKMDINRLITDFGIEPFAPIKEKIADQPSFIRRDIIAGHRDYNTIVDAIIKKKPFHVLTGFMPSGHPHFGHLTVMKEVIWHIQQGGKGFISMADREAHAVRGISWSACDRYAHEYIECLYALGFSGEIYSQRRNNALKDLAFDAAMKVSFSELSAIYGFGPETKLAHAVSVSMQVADILYPQLVAGVAPTVVPVGIDQDPHIRLTRNIANAFRMFLVEDRGNYISIRDKSAPKNALDVIAKRFSGSRKYRGHVDLPTEYTFIETDAVVREIEREFGGFGFLMPSATYNSFLQGLQGGKMSSSIPNSLILFNDPDSEVKKKILGALTGGRQTLEEQKKLGGRPERCSIYQLCRFHTQDNDIMLAEMCRTCKSGELMCGFCKKEVLERVRIFLREFKERRDEIAHMVKW